MIMLPVPQLLKFGRTESVGRDPEVSIEQGIRCDDAGDSHDDNSQLY